MNDRHVPEVGDPLDLPHATTPGRLVLSRGNLFCVTTSMGDVFPPGARELGLFHEDTRHLSRYELVLPARATLLSSGTESSLAAQIDLTTTGEEQGGLLDEPVNFLHLRRRQILDAGFSEQLAFTNHLARHVELDVFLYFDADFADVFEVRGARRARRGTREPALVERDRVELRYRSVDGLAYRTVVRFDPAPAELVAGRARLRLRLAPGESVEHAVEVVALRGDVALSAPMRPFASRLAEARAEAAAFRAGTTGVRCDDEVVSRMLQRSLADVHALRVQHDGRWIVGAGIPWFAAPFGRDSLLTSCQLLPFAPDLAGETLRFLAHHQGRVEDPAREEEPGRICHELRRGEMARAGEIPHSPYYGSIDSTPLFVVLLGETWRWTRDAALLAELWPALRAAMGWLDRRTADGTRFLVYQRATPLGLENQGWKDSRDGVSFPDGRRAATPLALVEAQGYAAQAWLHAAEIAAALGEAGLAAAWASRVAPFLRRLEDAFWVEELGTYALALDAHGERVTTVSSNPGHLLWSRAAEPARARRVAATLLSPEMHSGWGIRTVARGQPVFNPVSYHNGSVWPHDNALAALGMSRYGLQAEACRVAEAMLDASEHFSDHRLPELFCGIGRGEGEFLVHYPVSCSPQAWASGASFMLLQAALGLDADAPNHVLRVRNPLLPRPLRRLDLVDVRVGSALVSIRFQRVGRRTHADVLDVRGEPLKIEIVVG
ncbi:MAG: glycogen debranching N-terminal domain-containing protein [Myxococcota bacterium]